MAPQTGEKKFFETSFGKEEALYFHIDNNEHWVKRFLNYGRYEVQGLVAIGGFGCVFEAVDRWNYNHEVVIKTPYYLGDYCRPYIARAQTAFEKQIRNLNKLYEWEKKNLIGFSNAGFDSIVNLNDAFVDRGLDLCQSFRDAAGVQYFVSEELRENVPFLVMKYIRGESLKDILAVAPLTQIQTLRLAKQILTLMRHLHQPRKTKKGRSFYYLLCDLKAENILVEGGEQIVLIDFGAVKIYWIDQLEVELPIFVTDGYAAPEVYSGSLEFRDNPRIDQRFDIFTMGALMAHCLTSQHPSKFLVAQTPPQHNFDLERYHNIAPPIKDVIYRATAPNCKDRYADADTMLKAIWHALEEIG